jgi:hypothetical protein
MAIHSALQMEDGNVLIADAGGRVGILYPGSSIDDLDQSTNDTHWYTAGLNYPHALAYNPVTKHVYVGAYLKIHELEYIDSGAQATLKEVAAYDISQYYLRCVQYNECEENEAWEDGIHDIYPVYGATSPLFFLSTGERTFLFDPKANLLTSRPFGPTLVEATLSAYNPFHEVDSYLSQQEAPSADRDAVILKKGGIKSLSGSLGKQDYFTLAHPAPWLTPDVNYPYDNKILLYAESDGDTTDYDLTSHNHISFDPWLSMDFYKARLMSDDVPESINHLCFLFNDGTYIQCDIFNRRTQASGSTTSAWRGMNADQASEISAALNLQDGKIYFFLRNGNYVRYDIAQEIIDQAEIPVSSGWPGISDAQATQISAALYYPTNKIYFFLSNGNYLRFDVAQNQADQPELPTSADWPGITNEEATGIIAAVAYPNSRAYLFLSNGNYLIFNTETNQLDGRGDTPNDWPGISLAASQRLSAALY